MRLETRILLPIFAALVVVGGSALATALYVADDHASADAHAQLARVSATLGAQMDDAVAAQQSGAGILASVAPVPWREDAKAFGALARHFSADEFNAIVVLDANGTELARYEDGVPVAPRAGSHAAEWSFQALAARPGQGPLLMQAREGATALLVTLAPVTDAQGAFAGAIRGETRAAALAAPLVALPLPPGMSAQLQDEAGSRIGGAEGPALPGEGADARTQALATLRAPDGSLHAWRLVAHVDESAIRASQRALTLTLVGAVAAGALVVTAIIVVVSRRSLAPLGHVFATVERIGRGDLSARVPPPGGDDEVAALAEGVNHMAERLEAREAAARSDAAARARLERLASLGSVSAGVAHEVNNPLTFMRGSLELFEMELEEIRSDPASGPQMRALAERGLEVMRLNVEGIDRIARIVRSLRLLAKPQGGREVVDLRDVVDAALTLTEARLIAVPEVESDVPPGLRVVGDPDGLGQVVVNLLLNAADAVSPERGRVRVAGSSGNGRVRLVVEDNGRGVAPEARERIFTPFFTTKADGSGLGLSLAQRIAEDHEGTLRFEDAPGGGTRFILDLPAAEPLGRVAASQRA